MAALDYAAAVALMEHGHIYHEHGGIGMFYAGALLKAKGVRHGFTARKGGVSAPPYDSLNLGTSKDEPWENVECNFKIFCNAEGLDYGRLAVVNYEHGTNVLAITRADCGRGFSAEPLPFCDGLVTNDPWVTLVTSHADCGAFFLFDPVRRAVGLCHAGWKGTLGRIGAAAINLMCSEYGSQPGDIIAANGPCICQACFEVDMDLALKFEREFGLKCHVPGKPQKAQLDLELAGAVQLLDAGIRPENITLMHACTFELADRLFSHRRDKGDTGSMAAYITLE